MRSCFLFFPLFIVLGGCATSPALLTVTPQGSNGQKVVLSDDSTTVASVATEGSVWASTVKEVPVSEEYLEIELGFLIQSQQSSEIRLQNISAKDGNARIIRILTPEEHALAAEKKLKIKTQNVDLSMQGFGSAYQNSGSIGGDVYSGSGNYNQGGGLAQADAARSVQSLEKALDAEINSYLANRTIFPDQDYAGKIWLAMPVDRGEGFELVLTVPLASDVHTFEFSVQTGAR